MELSIFKSIERGLLAKIYLFYGSERYLLDEAVQRIYQQVVKEDVADFNYDSFTGEDVSVAQVLAAADTLPVFTDRRLVVAHQPNWFSTKKKLTDHEQELLVKYFADPCSSTCLIIVAGEKIDSRKKTVKAIKNKGQVVAFEPLKGYQLQNWMKIRFEKANKKVQRDVLEYLALAVGSHLGLLAGEIEKLVSYAGQGREIDLSMAKKVISRSSLVSVFDLTDHLAAKDIEKAMKLFRELVQSGENPVKIFSLISSHFMTVFQVKVMTEKGYREPEIVKKMGVHPYVVKKSSQQARLFSRERLEELLITLLDIDWKIKSGGGEAIASVEMGMFKIIK